MPMIHVPFRCVVKIDPLDPGSFPIKRAARGRFDYEGKGKKKTPSTFAQPITRWPDLRGGRPPTPAIVTITLNGGGKFAL